MAASDAQVQAYSDQRVRPRCEQLRNLLVAIADDKATIDDIYAALTAPSPTWIDARDDFPPHLLTGNDVLAWNTFITGMQKLQAGTFADLTEANSFAAQWAIILKACVRPVLG